jgi:2'-5' RNA ligase
MLQGIASILDAQHSSIVESIWDDLRNKFGAKTTSLLQPHFTYQVAERYDTEPADQVLRRFTRSAEPFMIRTSGLGIFTGETPVIYVPIVRTDSLSRFQAALWESIASAAHNLHAHHYGSENWLPHITLAAPGDLSSKQLADAIRLLGNRSFNWQIRIDNLAFALDAQNAREWVRYPFSAVSS